MDDLHKGSIIKKYKPNNMNNGRNYFSIRGHNHIVNI